MKRLLVSSPYAGLVITGMVASIALLIESQLPVSSNIHFFLQFVWLGVVGASLLAFAMMSTLKSSCTTAPLMGEVEADPPAAVTAEFLDEDGL